jgi:hypothetical protein
LPAGLDPDDTQLALKVAEACCQTSPATLPAVVPERSTAGNGGGIMQLDEWTPPPVAPAASIEPPRRRRGLVLGAGLVGAGVVAGAIVGGTVLSDAATSSPTPNASSSSSPEAPGAPGPWQNGRGHGPGGDLSLTGTVTAVGSSSVTIKTSSGTAEYKVDSNSDIDKNGEAKISDLKAGDAVRFSVTSGNVINILHAGNEALNHPHGGPGSGGESGG